MSAAIIERPSRWKWLAEMLPGSIVHSSMNAFDISKDMNIMNDPELQSIGFPSAVGFGTAKSLAKLYDYLANNGSINGKKMLSAHQVIALSTPVTQNIPVILAPDNPYAMGTLIDTSVQGQITFGHRGYGGQNAFADPTNGIGVSYVTNFNGRHSETDDPRAYDLLMALYKSLQKYNNKGTQ
uniref:Beta-lactamase-related domain-containing protein n=1 Tax=Arion vulgaris TaxID=1028688 RepID=A0A0B7AMJ3_9EUPU